MEPGELNHRQAIVTGRYLNDDEFFSIGRTYDGVSGTMVLTPLELEDGSVMIVVRGLVPVGTEGPPAAGYEVPQGQVTVTGRLDDGEEPLRIGEPPPDSGVIEGISRIDLAYIDQYYARDVLPVDIVLETQQPGNEDSAPFPIPVEELTEGRHLGYAVQWFAFAVVALVGTVVLIWRAGTERPTSENEMETVTPG
jgi:cytochrome oxidase assembly protein ShyY1